MLKYIAPFKLILYSFLSWFLAYIFIPTSYIVKGNRFFALAILFCYVGFLILGFRSANKIKNQNYIPSKIDFFGIKLAFFIGVFGFILKVIQIVFIQKSFSVNTYELRVNNQFTEFNSGGIGVIIALTFPFAIIAFLSIIYYYKHFSKKMIIAATIVASLYIFDSLVNGSRLPIALILIISIIVWVFSQAHHGKLLLKTISIKLYGYKLLNMHKFFFTKKMLLFVIVGVLSYNFFINVMVKRLDYYEYDDVLTYWEIQHDSKINSDYKIKINKLPNKDKNRAVAKYSLLHYFTHAPFEFQKLVNHVDDPYGIFYGKYEFDVYFKFLRFLNIPVKSKLEMDKVLYHDGYYITFWGPFYIDFGIFGILIAFVLGYLIKKTYLMARNGYLPAILMYSYIAVVLLASFHVSLFGGKYIYIFNAILVFWMLNRTLRYLFKQGVSKK